MNLFELSGCAFAVGGAAVASKLGYSHFGVIGGVIGVPVGFVAGWFGGSGIVSACFISDIWQERLKQHRDLKSHFGNYWKKERIAEWESAMDEMKVDEIVTGIVIQEYYYGVFLDIGSSFPALLTRLYSEFDTGAPGYKEGEQVTARIREMNSKEHLVELTQLSDGESGFNKANQKPD